MPDNEIDAILQERKKYTPSLDHVRNKYARIMKTDGTMAQAISKQKEFDRALAAHDQALREEIAREIEMAWRSITSNAARQDSFDLQQAIYDAYSKRKEGE